MILLPLEKGVGGILKQTTFHTQATLGNENFMLGCLCLQLTDTSSL